MDISLESQRIWVHMLFQLVAMQTEITRSKVHAVGRGKQ